MKMQVNERDSRFELLRIIAIFMITIYHFYFVGQLYRMPVGLVSRITHPGTSIMDSLFIPFGKIGVMLFVMITGYFLANEVVSVKKTVKRVWRVWSEAFAYSAIFLLFDIVMVISRQGPLSKALIKLLLEELLPFTFNAYWFVTAYIMLIVFSPFILTGIRQLKQSQLVVLIVIVTLFNTLSTIENQTFTLGGAGLGTILLPLLLGIYIRNYGIVLKHKGMMLFGLLVGMSVLDVITMMFSNDGVLPAFGAVLIFLLVLDVPVFNSSIINLIAPTSFAVYLFQHNILHREQVTVFMRFARVDNMFVIMLLSILWTISLFIIVFLIDQFRMRLFKQFGVSDWLDPIFKLKYFKHLEGWF